MQSRYSEQSAEQSASTSPASDPLIALMTRFKQEQGASGAVFAHEGDAILRMLEVQIRDSEILVLGVVPDGRGQLMGVRVLGSSGQFREMKIRFQHNSKWDFNAKALMDHGELWSFRPKASARPVDAGCTCEVTEPRCIEALLAKLNAMNPQQSSLPVKTGGPQHHSTARRSYPATGAPEVPSLNEELPRSG